MCGLYRGMVLIQLLLHRLLRVLLVSTHLSHSLLHCSEEVFDDFPLTGPRTTSWCLRFLRRRRCPADHHMKFRTITKLPVDAWGMAEHESLCQLIDFAGCYDQQIRRPYRTKNYEMASGTGSSYP